MVSGQKIIKLYVMLGIIIAKKAALLIFDDFLKDRNNEIELDLIYNRIVIRMRQKILSLKINHPGLSICPSLAIKLPMKLI